MASGTRTFGGSRERAVVSVLVAGMIERLYCEGEVANRAMGELPNRSELTDLHVFHFTAYG